jgi:hypothetical protein
LAKLLHYDWVPVPLVYTQVKIWLKLLPQSRNENIEMEFYFILNFDFFPQETKNSQLNVTFFKN